MESVGWKILKNGSSFDKVILAVDFDATGRREVRFSDLAVNLEPDYPLWETGPPPVSTEAARTGPSHVTYWARMIVPRCAAPPTGPPAPTL